MGGAIYFAAIRYGIDAAAGLFTVYQQIMDVRSMYWPVENAI